MGGDGVVDIVGMRERAVDADWLLYDHAGRMDATAENVAAAAAFVFRRWRERAVELGLEEPSDLSGACKFCALFAKALFGGVLDGNYDHVFVRVGGEVIDLAAGSREVAGMAEPYRSDDEFLEMEDFHYSMGTCLGRVRRWIAEFPACPPPGPTP